MGVHPKLAQSQTGVSIITCTNRPEYIDNLFNNNSRQRFIKKELIVILNNDKMNLDKYRKLAKTYKHVRIYRLPEKISLGSCLNFGVKKSKCGYVAKFDDDDYYAPCYLADNILAMNRTKADIIGKRAHFMYSGGF